MNASLPAVQIMKSDEDVRMISAEAPVLFAKVGDMHATGSPSPSCKLPAAAAACWRAAVISC